MIAKKLKRSEHETKWRKEKWLFWYSKKH
jgi:hypothetical protein